MSKCRGISHTEIRLCAPIWVCDWFVDRGLLSLSTVSGVMAGNGFCWWLVGVFGLIVEPIWVCDWFADRGLLSLSTVSGVMAGNGFCWWLVGLIVEPSWVYEWIADRGLLSLSGVMAGGNGFCWWLVGLFVVDSLLSWSTVRCLGGFGGWVVVGGGGVFRLCFAGAGLFSVGGTLIIAGGSFVTDGLSVADSVRGVFYFYARDSFVSFFFFFTD
jgi:hypothetical protein